MMTGEVDNEVLTFSVGILYKPFSRVFSTILNIMFLTFFVFTLNIFLLCFWYLSGGWVGGFPDPWASLFFRFYPRFFISDLILLSDRVSSSNFYCLTSAFTKLF